MCVRKEGNHMMKRSQTKKISAMLAAMAVLWGGTLTFGGDSVSAADYVNWEKIQLVGIIELLNLT